MPSKLYSVLAEKLCGVIKGRPSEKKDIDWLIYRSFATQLREYFKELERLLLQPLQMLLSTDGVIGRY